MVAGWDGQRRQAELWLQGVDPAEPGKAGEVAIGRVQDTAEFDGEGCELRVTGERTTDLAFDQHLAVNCPVPFAWRESLDLGADEPLIDQGDGLLHRERVGQIGIGCDTKKSGDRLPGNSDRVGAGECSF